MASPSPTGPLLILGLVLPMWIAPLLFAQAPPSIITTAKASEPFPFAALVLVVPVVLIIVLQVMSTPDEVLNSTLLEFSLSKSTVILSGMVVLLLALVWLQSMIQSAL